MGLQQGTGNGAGGIVSTGTFPLGVGLAGMRVGVMIAAPGMESAATRSGFWSAQQGSSGVFGNGVARLSVV